MNTRPNNLHFNFLTNINNSYSPYIKQLLTQWINLQTKLIKLENQKLFLIKCRRHNILPQHLSFSSCKDIHFFEPRLSLKQNNFNALFQTKVLNLEIKDIHIHIKQLLRQSNYTKDSLLQSLPEQIANKFFFTQNMRIKKLNKQMNKTHAKKFNNLLNRHNHNDHTLTTNNEKWIKNLTDININQTVLNTIALGPKFSVPITKHNIPLTTVCAHLEKSLRFVTSEQVNLVRQTAIHKIYNFINRKPSPSQQSFQKKFFTNIKQTKQFFNEHPELLILKADKGNISVIISKQQYINDMTNIFEDKDTYETVKFEYTATYEKTVNQLISSWHKKEYITENIAKHLHTYSSYIPIAYGLPKIHKPTLSWRPIISTINSPFYKLASYLSKILSNIIEKTDNAALDSWKVTRALNNTPIPPNHILLSLDVISLFTNVPVNLVLDSINNRWTEITTHTSIPKDSFIKAVSLCLNSTVFKFNSKLYKQKFGCAMGSPLSPVVANLVMEDLEKSALNSLQFLPIFYKRYVDDIITCIPHDKIDDILNAFNSYHPRLQFTTETQNNNKLAFLDIEFCNSNDILITNWYHKETWSGRYISFDSNHPNQHKIGLVNGLIDRAILLSHHTYRKQNLQLIKQTLASNGYPHNFTKNIIKRRIHDIYHPIQKKIDRTEIIKKRGPITKLNIGSFPHIQGLSNDISRIFKKHNIHIIHNIYNTLSTVLPKFKDHIPTEHQSNIIYMIPCRDCEKCYIGQTGRQLHTRIKEHKKNILLPQQNHTALTKHTIESDHFFDFNNAKIIGKHKDTFFRTIRETIEIIKHKNSVNLKYDKPKVYDYYVHMF